MLSRYLLFLIVIAPFPAMAETGKPSYISPPAVISTESTLQMMGGLLLVLALIGGITWLLKRYSLIPTTTAGIVKVVATTGVGQRERVVIVEIDNTWLVLGVATGRVNKLHTMTKPTNEASDTISNGSPPSPVFAEQLNQSIKKENA
ncbi:MAG: flagellar biosynthetic protein FliO [Nitrosomonas sp.]|uniref:flagellar biosynthetic protein FliO n=1 Tax=Nitrosomonas sp. TaxID=42353 RepID=UPI0025D46C12|nr:flagellar biosynthetic protein FliO [Nitrosomonas sp.]MBY0474570.1 flagellar biosynthetic protein FliO [Nitrosomonas sp.]